MRNHLAGGGDFRWKDRRVVWGTGRDRATGPVRTPGRSQG